MAWFAQGLGVQPYPNTFSSTGGIRNGLNTALNTSYYISLNIGANESSLFGNATYDLRQDSHPMIFLVNAHNLPEWNHYDSSFIGHFIEGYAYTYWNTRPSDTSTEQIYYVDTASPSDGYGNVAGDYSMTFDDFYNQPWLTGGQYIVV